VVTDPLQPRPSAGRSAAPISPRRWTGPALYAALVAAAVFAAYQIHVYATRTTERPSADTGVYRGETPAPGVAGGEAGLEAIRATGLVPQKADPAGIAPPPRAVRLGAYSRRGGGQMQEMASYDWPGDVAAAGEHYRAVMAAGGYELLLDGARGLGRHVMVWSRGLTHVTVTLRPAADPEKMGRIGIAVVSPDANAQNAKGKD